MGKGTAYHAIPRTVPSTGVKSHACSHTGCSSVGEAKTGGSGELTAFLSVVLDKDCFNLIACVRVFCMHVHVCNTQGAQKMVANPPELEFQMVVKHHVGAGN